MVYLSLNSKDTVLVHFFDDEPYGKTIEVTGVYGFGGKIKNIWVNGCLAYTGKPD